MRHEAYVVVMLLSVHGNSNSGTLKIVLNKQKQLRLPDGKSIYRHGERESDSVPSPTVLCVHALVFQRQPRCVRTLFGQCYRNFLFDWSASSRGPEARTTDFTTQYLYLLYILADHGNSGNSRERPPVGRSALEANLSRSATQLVLYRPALPYSAVHHHRSVQYTVPVPTIKTHGQQSHSTLHPPRDTETDVWEQQKQRCWKQQGRSQHCDGDCGGESAKAASAPRLPVVPLRLTSKRPSWAA